MATILQKKKYERMLYSRPTLLILIILAIFIVGAVRNIYEKAQNTKENLALAETELKTLEDREDLLEEKLELLGTNKGIESEIREKFNVIKEGEHVIVIVDKEPEEIIEDHEYTKSLWGRIKALFRRDIPVH